MLNVGGTKYTTTVDTFAREPDSQLSHLVGSARYDTEVFIDRDGAVFAHILNYLRDGSIAGTSDDLRAQVRWPALTKHTTHATRNPPTHAHIHA